MTITRSSLFRDALQVSPERIALLSDADLGRLMFELFRAQSHRSGASQAEVRVNTEEKAKDDGCDGWTGKPTATDDWLGDSETCWQLKAGVAGEPAKLDGEVTKPIPKETLESGGRFVVVASGSTNGVKGEKDRLKVLCNNATASGLSIERIAVLGSEALTSWCNHNPAIAARWAGRPAGLCTLDDWSRADVHQVPWQSTDQISALMAEQRSMLEFDSGSVEHLHIQGQPGVGKTRYALELCRHAPWAPFVIYFRQAADIRLLELVDEAAQDVAVRLIVVADEIQPEQLLPLREAISRTNGRIRLVTVGHCKSPDSSRIPTYSVSPLEREQASLVVKGWYPSMPTEHVDFIVRFADGYVRLARLAADAVAKNMATDVRKLLDLDEIRVFLDRMLGNGDRRALHVVAVLSKVGWTDDVAIEGQTVAKHFGLDWNDVRARVHDFHQRFGIAPRGGRYTYVSPIPLGIYLAAEAWAIYPDLVRSLPDLLPSEDAKGAYYERLKLMASSPHAKEYAREELRFFFELGYFTELSAVRRWSTFSAADPDLASKCIFKVLNASSIEERARISGESRREIVWALVRLAWRSKSFYEATSSLALLAEAENESWGNNATGEFNSRFQIFLGGTAVPYIDRLRVIDDLIEKKRPLLSRLAVRALSKVGDTHASRSSNDQASDELPEEEWRPATWGDHAEAALAAIDRLTRLVSIFGFNDEDELILAAQNLSTLLRNRLVRHSVAAFFDAILNACPNTQERLRRIIASVLHREKKYWKELPESELTELEVLHQRFQGQSLPARIRQYVGQSRWDDDESVDLSQLARELLVSREVMREMWSWLTSGESVESWNLGSELASLDSEGSLLPLFEELAVGKGDFRIVCGYISVLRRKRGDLWYEGWVDSLFAAIPQTTSLVFEVIWRCGATARLVRVLGIVIQREKVPADVVGQLAYGGWAENVDPEDLRGLLDPLMHLGYRRTALPLLENRIRVRPTELGYWEDLAMLLIDSPDLIRGKHMEGHYWKELALRYVDGHVEHIAATIFAEQAKKREESWFIEYSEAAEVVQACVSKNPAAVWGALVPYLASRAGASMLSIGFPRNILSHVPIDHVLDWVEKNYEERAPIVARLGDKNFSNDDSLVARIVGSYGDNEAVGRAFFSEYVSGSWWGPASLHWIELAKSLDEVSKKSRYPKLRSWATETANSLREMSERDRRREEEDDIRRP